MTTGQHEVFLASAGENRVTIMAALRRRLGISPLEAKHLVDEPSARICAGSAFEVNDLVDELQEMGARVVVKPELPRIPLWMRPAPRTSPREHHYEFAHVVLVDFFRRGAPKLWSLLNTEDGEARLRHIWQRIGEAFEGDARCEDSDVSLVVGSVGDVEIAVITLPPPLAHAEAYFVALVHYPEDSDDFRYMTLERGVDLASGGSQTFLCEWTIQGHGTLGSGPPPTLAAFVESIVSRIAPEMRSSPIELEQQVCPCGSGAPFAECHGAEPQA